LLFKIDTLHWLGGRTFKEMSRAQIE
jgi:hypothetical protein